MIAKGRPTIEITKGDEKLSPCFELYHYAEEIKKILTMADRALGIAGERIKYNCISSMLSKIEAESGEYIRLIKELPPEELDDFCDEYSAECDCRLQCDGEDLSKLGVFIDMILEEEKRGQEDDEYCSWPQQKKNGLYWSTYLLSVLVRKLENERKEAYGLLESAGERPDKPIAILRREACAPEAPANGERAKKGKSVPHHYCLPHSESDKARLKRVLKKLKEKRYVPKTTKESAWIFVCTGEGKVPDAPIQWLKDNDELGYFVSKFFSDRNRYDRAVHCFLLKDGDTPNATNLRTNVTKKNDKTAPLDEIIQLL